MPFWFNNYYFTLVAKIGYKNRVGIKLFTQSIYLAQRKSY